MVVLVNVWNLWAACKIIDRDGIWNPLVEDDLLRDRIRSKIAVKLYLKEISLHQTIDSDALVLWLLETFSSNG